MLHRSEVWLYTLSITNSHKGLGGISWLTRSMWEESRMNHWFSWMPQSRRIPNDVCESNHLTQPTDTNGDSGTQRQICSGGRWRWNEMISANSPWAQSWESALHILQFKPMNSLLLEAFIKESAERLRQFFISTGTCSSRSCTLLAWFGSSAFLASTAQWNITPVAVLLL